LAATILAQRPELKDKMLRVALTEAIPDAPPENFFAKHVLEIEGIGEATNPCFFIHSQTNPANWYLPPNNYTNL